MEELAALMEILQNEHKLDLEKDHLVLLGDLVDVGPDTSAVVEFALQHKQRYPKNFHVVQGNHDLMLTDALLHDAAGIGEYNIWFNQGGRQSVSSYFPKELDNYERAISQPLEHIPQSHLDFLEGLRWYWETDKFFFVHGGMPPKIALDPTKAHYDLHPEKLFEPDSPLWIREEFYWSEYDWGKKIIFAHTPFSDGKGGFKVWKKDNMLGINTMPRNEGHLTCAILDEDNPDDVVLVEQEKIGDIAF